MRAQQIMKRAAADRSKRIGCRFRTLHRLPVMRGKILVGILTRSNLLQAVASMAREIPDPTADDDHIRDRIIRTINGMSWAPRSLQELARG